MSGTNRVPFTDAGGGDYPRPSGYEILGELGRGGMGVVYKARHLALNRIVALKLIAPQHAAGPDAAARFTREAEALARLQHPNIVQIYEVGTSPAGWRYLAIEYVEGGTLAQHLAGRPLPPEAAAHLVLTLARAVHHVHQRGLLHRDLKPANVLLQPWDPGCQRGPEGTADTLAGEAGLAAAGVVVRLGGRPFLPRLSDFGLARALDGADGITHPGAVLGTPAYMAPEQAAGKASQVGPATDVYALGVILYEALTGERPFRGETPLETLDLVRTRAPRPPRQLQPHIPAELEQVCLRCLEKEPSRRYATALALAGALEAHAAGASATVPETVAWPPPRPRRLARRAALAAALLAAGLAGWLGWQALWPPAGGGPPEPAPQPAPAPAQGGAPKDKDKAEPPPPAQGPPRFAELRKGHAWPPHKDRLGPLAISPDGKLLAVGLRVACVQILDADKGAATFGHIEQHAILDNFRFAPDGATLAVAGFAGLKPLSLWELPKQRERPVVQRGVKEKKADGIGEVVFAPSGKLFAAVTKDDFNRKEAGAVTLYETATGKPLAAVPHANVGALAFSQDGELLATGGADGTVRLWAVPGLADRGQFQLGGPVECVCFSPDGARLAAGSSWGIAPQKGAEVKLWEVQERRASTLLTALQLPVQAVGFAPDGTVLAALSGQRVRFVMVPGGKELEPLALGHGYPRNSIRFLPDRRTLAMVGNDEVTLWDLASRKRLERVEDVAHAALSADGRRLAVITPHLQRNVVQVYELIFAPAAK